MTAKWGAAAAIHPPGDGTATAAVSAQSRKD